LHGGVLGGSKAALLTETLGLNKLPSYGIYMRRAAGTTRRRSRAMDTKEYLDLQRSEIERHKWIESEKVGRDLGVEAVIDWIMKYAHLFSDYHLRNGRS
jgi:hypothetical protein